jgi:hypothetical protein
MTGDTSVRESMPFTVRLRRGQMMGMPESRNGPRPWQRFPFTKSGVLSQEIHRAM